MNAVIFRLIGAIFLIYFVPSFLAIARGNRDMHKILLVNFYTGWTIVGWITALRWAWDRKLCHRSVLIRHPQARPNEAAQPRGLKTWRQDIRHPY